MYISSPPKKIKTNHHHLLLRKPWIYNSIVNNKWENKPISQIIGVKKIMYLSIYIYNNIVRK